MGKGIGAGPGRPAGAGNKPKRPLTMQGGRRATGWDTIPGVAPARASAGMSRGAGTSGGTSGIYNYAAPSTAPTTHSTEPEIEDEVDPDSEDECEESDYVKDGPLLEAVKKAVRTTLPKVEGQQRNGSLNMAKWKDYKFRLPLGTLSDTPQSPSAHIVRKCTVLAPHEFHGDAAGAICCVKCGCAARVRVHGWSKYLRVFNKLDKKTYAYSRVYKYVHVRLLARVHLVLLRFAPPFQRALRLFSRVLTTAPPAPNVTQVPQMPSATNPRSGGSQRTPQGQDLRYAPPQGVGTAA